MKAEEIKERRMAMSLTQEELAHRLGVRVATVQRWEKGQHIPSNLAEDRLKAMFRGSAPTIQVA